MSILAKFSLLRYLSHLKPARSDAGTQKLNDVESGDQKGGEDISLERIKDLIIEAYALVDDNRRELLLDRADRLEAQLVEAYRAKGLRITADNICNTLEDHRRRYYHS